MKVFFEDEGIFRADEQSGALLGPAWSAPARGGAEDSGIPLCLLSRLSARRGALFSLILPQANAATAEIFFNEFSAAHASYRVVMVMDQASWHPRERDERWDNIRFIHQPAHSPELNPAEHLWEHMRERYFHNQAFSSLDALEGSLFGLFERWKTISRPFNRSQGFTGQSSTSDSEMVSA